MKINAPKIITLALTVLVGSGLASSGFAQQSTVIRTPRDYVSGQLQEIQNIINQEKIDLENKAQEIYNRGEEIRAEFMQDEVIVRFQGEQNFRRVRLNFGEDINETLRRYKSRGNVVYAEPNYIAHTFGIPSDPYYNFQWNLQGGSGGINAEVAWEISSGEGVTVAVIDTGVAYEDYRSGRERFYQAPDLSQTQFVPGYDFVNNDTHPNDDEGHGTHVTGTIAGSTNNNKGVAGVAYGAKIMPIKVLNWRGSGTYADIAEGIKFAADNGAKVINLSLGGPVGTSYLKEALAYAYDKGVVIVAAAGNSNTSVAYPAAYDEYVIAVGATRYDEQKAPYSNYGSSLDLVAPGGDNNVDQNQDGYIDGILQETFYRRYDRFGYYFYQGTSMAAPHVAGVVALVLSSNPNFNPDEVRQILQSTAKDLGSPGHDPTFGWGLVNAARALGYSASGPDSSPAPIPEPEPEPVDSPPTISLLNPKNSEKVSSTVSVVATADDDIGISRVEFQIDGNLIATDLFSPYETFWDTSNLQNGSYLITAVAFDNAGQNSSDSVSITVENVAEETPPVPPSEDPGESPDTTVLFEDSFENDLNQWTASGQDLWSISQDQSTDGIYSARFQGESDDLSLTSPNIYVQGVSGVVTFSWYIDRRIDRNEYLAFDVSYDGGSAWQELARLRGNVDKERVWHEETFSLDGSVNVKIRFRGTASRSSEYGYIDNVVVKKSE